MTSKKGMFSFIFFSILGFALFLVPFNMGGESKIFISHFSSFITSNFFTPFMIFTQIVAALVLLLSIVFIFYTSESEYINGLFKASPLNIMGRVLGSFLYLLVLNGELITSQEWYINNTFISTIGNAILNPDAGGVMAGDGGLLTTLYITFFIGILILPLITHFGAVEYVGTIAAPFVEKVFKVPGYSAVDAIASFVGDGTIGVVVTDTQYKRGYYSKREAYIIATSFSIVGIAFASAVAEELGFSNIFPIFYLTIAVSAVLIAIITARLPLKKFPHQYFEGQQPKTYKKPEGLTTNQHAIELACKQATETSISQVIKDSFHTILNVYIGFLPIIMVVGTFSLVVCNETDFFYILSYPLIPFYELLGFTTEVAKAMAPATIVGFADMYLPALFIGSAESEAARFFIGILAFTQLVYMSETGMVLLKSSLGINFLDIVKIFLYRTILSIPIVLGLTYIISLLGFISF